MPTSLSNALGNPGHRAISHEPVPPPASQDLLEAPEFLDERGVAEWNRIAPMLARMRVLTDVDKTALAAYCNTSAFTFSASTRSVKTGWLTLRPASRAVKS